MFLNLQNIHFRTKALHSAYACAAFDSNHGIGYSKLSSIEHLTCVSIKSRNYPKPGKQSKESKRSQRYLTSTVDE